MIKTIQGTWNDAPDDTLVSVKAWVSNGSLLGGNWFHVVPADSDYGWQVESKRVRFEDAPALVKDCVMLVQHEGRHAPVVDKILDAWPARTINGKPVRRHV